MERYTALAAGLVRRARVRGWSWPGRWPRLEAAIAAGAICGVGARYLLGTLIGGLWSGRLPLATLLINLLGCLLIGLVQTLALELIAMPRELQVLLAVGLLGGFTTFSSFSVETVQLLRQGALLTALAYQMLSLGSGLPAVVLGSALARWAHLRCVRGRRR